MDTRDVKTLKGRLMTTGCLWFFIFSNISVLHPLPEGSDVGVDGRHGVVTASDAKAGHPKKKPAVFQFPHQGAA